MRTSSIVNRRRTIAVTTRNPRVTARPAIGPSTRNIRQRTGLVDYS